MNKKEILEIRKQFCPEKCTITRICGCYVDHEKEKKALIKKAFLSMPEEEAFKYYDIFKHTLSGTVGKNLLTLGFPTAQEMPGGTQEFLLKLRDTKLKDDVLIDAFYDKIIESYEYLENYYIILIHAAYDVPGKAGDGMAMFDASDTVYEHILMSICPVNLTKAGLTYNAETNNIEEGARDWFVEMPIQGFLFPAFHDRTGDIHQILYYSKKPEEIKPAFITELFGSPVPLTAKDQKVAFNELIGNAISQSSMKDNERNLDVVKTVHATLNEWIAEAKESPEPLTLTKPETKRLLTISGVEETTLVDFEADYDSIVGEDKILIANNIAETKKWVLSTPDVVVKVNPERADLVETKEIDGRKCLVIPIDEHLEVNGIEI